MAVPAGAMLKYRSAFGEKDGERFKDYLAEVSTGKKKIHCENLFPYELVRPFFGRYSIREYGINGEEVLEALWNNLPADFGNGNAISVIDTSGSMYCGKSDSITPALISQSLGLYHAERCKGRFHNHFISFSSVPELIEIHGSTLKDKLRYIQSAKWGCSTNLEGVFTLILTTAVEARCRQDEMLLETVHKTVF